MVSPGTEREHVKGMREIAKELRRIADALERSNKIKALELTERKSKIEQEWTITLNNAKEDKNNE